MITDIKIFKIVESENQFRPQSRDELKDLIDKCFENDIYDLNFIDTSLITDMSWLFDNIKHTFNISEWNVSNVTTMDYMFDNSELEKQNKIPEWYKN